MSSTTESRTAISLTPPSTLRLRLQLSPARPVTVTAPQSIQLSTWEWEGGHLRDRTGLDRNLTICPDLRGALAAERHEPANPSPRALAGGMAARRPEMDVAFPG